MDLTHATTTEHIVIRRITPDRPLAWLKLAVLDLRHSAANSLMYGALFTAMGMLLALYYSTEPQWVLSLATLFLLVGPFLAIGLFDLARQQERQGKTRTISLRHSLVAWRDNLQGFTLYAALLALLAFSWLRVSLLIFALFFDYSALPTLSQVVQQAFLPQNIDFLLAYFGSGFLFAMLAFAASAFAVPMMLDKEVDAITAMLVSMQAVHKNLMTMSLWAAMIVILTVIGLASYCVGLLFVMPLIALASWHAYRETIAYE